MCPAADASVLLGVLLVLLYCIGVCTPTFPAMQGMQAAGASAPPTGAFPPACLPTPPWGLSCAYLRRGEPLNHRKNKKGAFS